MTQDLYQEIKKYLRDVIHRTVWEGRVYLVGGCVRDSVLDNEVSDIDLCINIPRGGIRFLFWLRDQGIIYDDFQLFRRFGTGKFRFLKYPDIEFDTCAPHVEGEEFVHIHVSEEDLQAPISAYLNLMNDCEERDLTINSLYENLTTGKILDFTGLGKSDLENHIIRTTIEPGLVYKKNPACILRTLRFAVKYDFDIHEDTWNGVNACIPLFREARKSRIEKEFEKVLQAPKSQVIIDMLESLNALPLIAEKLNSKEKNTPYIMPKRKKDRGLTDPTVKAKKKKKKKNPGLTIRNKRKKEKA